MTPSRALLEALRSAVANEDIMTGGDGEGLNLQGIVAPYVHRTDLVAGELSLESTKIGFSNPLYTGGADTAYREPGTDNERIEFVNAHRNQIYSQGIDEPFTVYGYALTGVTDGTLIGTMELETPIVITDDDQFLPRAVPAFVFRPEAFR